MPQRAVLVALGVCALSGCTSLQTLPDNFRTDNRDQALEGFPYALPMRQFDLTASWTLTDCVNRTPTKPDDIPETKITPDLEVVSLLSPGERYLIDYRALASAMKTTDLAIETYPEGTLKSINAAADDRSAETAVALAKAVASVATFTVGGAVPAPPPPSPPVKMDTDAKHVVLTCSQAALGQLAKVKAAEEALEAKTERVKDASILVEQLALAGMLDSTKRTELASALESLRKASGELDAAKKTLATARRPLQVRKVGRWPDDFGAGGVESASISVEPTAGFLALFEPVETTAPGACVVDPESTWQNCVAERTRMYARLQPAIAMNQPCGPLPDGGATRFSCTFAKLEAPPRNPGQEYTPAEWRDYQEKKALWAASRATDARDALPDKGLFVRPPELGRLIACKTAEPCDPENPVDFKNPDVIKASDWVAIPQLGQLRFLPFENRMFENNALVIQLAKDGTVEKFQYATKAAIAERMAGAAASMAEAATAGRKAWREERAARRTEQIAELEHEIALYDKRKARDALGQTAVAGDADADEEAEQAQKIALKIELEIEDRLLEAQAGND